MLRKAFAMLGVLALIISLGGIAGRAEVAAAANCTAEQGQRFIDEGRYARAVDEFSCVINAQPTGVEGYRGRIEALLLLGSYSDAVRDYTRVTAFVLPVHADAASTIYAGYDARLAIAPASIPALMGASFARWYFFQYAQAIQVLTNLLDVEPDNVYGNTFRGSSRLLQGATRDKGQADLERALALKPQSADVHFIVADAYTYGLPNPARAFAEATLALNGGLDTPRIHAILGSAYLAFGDQLSAAIHIQRHIDLVTTELLTAPSIPAGTSLALGLVPGRTYEVPITALAGETVSIMTGSKDYWDTILVLLDPDGTPVLGADDTKAYFAGFTWVAPASGTYRMRVTFFESVNYGTLLVARN